MGAVGAFSASGQTSFCHVHIQKPSVYLLPSLVKGKPFLTSVSIYLQLLVLKLPIEMS